MNASSVLALSAKKSPSAIAFVFLGHTIPSCMVWPGRRQHGSLDGVAIVTAGAFEPNRDFDGFVAELSARERAMKGNANSFARPELLDRDHETRR